MHPNRDKVFSDKEMSIKQFEGKLYYDKKGLN